VPEELVNTASSARPCGLVSEEPGQPACPGLSPVAWDYLWDFRPRFYSLPSVPVLSMNWAHHNLFLIPDNELICTAYSPEHVCEQLANNENQPFQNNAIFIPGTELFTIFKGRQWLR
jgi:hypothetical protein